MKRKHHVILLIAFFTATPAFAGIPVMDLGNITQSIAQVAAWGRQYGQMVVQLQNQVRQIQQLQTQLNSINGVRSLGQVVNNLGLDEVVPVAILNQLTDIQTSVDLVNNIRGMADSSLRGTLARAAQIQQLMQEINATTDPKAVAEIQARIGAETAAVANDSARIALMDMQQRIESERINNDIKTRNDANVTSTARTDADFTNLFTLGQ